tara:strand:+ start:2766 stop:3278 length:513 start_codon:yes stop_codon:yes gene_type:complete
MAVTTLNYLATFHCNVFYNKDSQNLLGFNSTPRYWLEPTELIEMVEVNIDPASVDRGFQKDVETGWFLRNIPNYTKSNGDVDFVKLKFTPPYGFDDDYQNWFQLVSANWLQKKLEGFYQEHDVDSLPKGESMGGKYPYCTLRMMDVITKTVNTNKYYNVSDKKHCHIHLK